MNQKKYMILNISNMYKHVQQNNNFYPTTLKTIFFYSSFNRKTTRYDKSRLTIYQHLFTPA